jgi:hypothetical protein
VVDRTGAVVVGARVRLRREDQSLNEEVLSGKDGQFSVANIAAGPFLLSITSAGFEAQKSSGILHSGETYIVPPIALAFATAITEVRVGLSPAEVAQEQVQDEEKQRVMGFIPNFYVSYVPDAAPLTSKQKFGLAWKTRWILSASDWSPSLRACNRCKMISVDTARVRKVMPSATAPLMPILFWGTFIGSAILPSLLKQVISTRKR